ncbi:TRAP transporter TAXI family solute receptor [Bradyrhizobium sp. GM22.5]
MRNALRMALAAIMMIYAFAARAEQTEYDPAKVSDSLKAIFQFGSTSTKQSLNANTVTLITGTIGGTYVQFGADLASVLDDGNRIRVLPIVGRGSVQSVADILFLQGVDLGIVRADTLDYLERKGFAKDIKKQFTYVTKLYNEEMQVIAPKSVATLKDLEGKTVSVDLPNGGTFVTALTVFERLGIKAKFVYVEQRIAMEKLKAGEIDAVIVVGGKPYKSVSTFGNDGRFHLATVDYAKPLQSDYLPATLTAKDYPNLVKEGESVDTIAVPAVLAAYNWAPNTERYRKLALYVDAFFTKFPTLQNPPFHPKWQGGLARGAPGGLEQIAGGAAMARPPRRRTGDAATLRGVPATEPLGRKSVRRGQGNAVQAIPGVGRRKGPGPGAGAGAGGEEVASSHPHIQLSSPAKAAIQHSETVMVQSEGRGVLDSAPSRGMTAEYAATAIARLPAPPHPPRASARRGRLRDARS